jgi:hypothetical protein
VRTDVCASPEWIDPEGNIDEDDPTKKDDLSERVSWGRHRVPFEKAFEFRALLAIKPGDEGEEFLEEVEKEW